MPGLRRAGRLVGRHHAKGTATPSTHRTSIHPASKVRSVSETLGSCLARPPDRIQEIRQQETELRGMRHAGAHSK